MSNMFPLLQRLDANNSESEKSSRLQVYSCVSLYGAKAKIYVKAYRHDVLCSCILSLPVCMASSSEESLHYQFHENL